MLTAATFTFTFSVPCSKHSQALLILVQHEHIQFSGLLAARYPPITRGRLPGSLSTSPSCMPTFNIPQSVSGPLVLPPATSV